MRGTRHVRASANSLTTGSNVDFAAAVAIVSL